MNKRSFILIISFVLSFSLRSLAQKDSSAFCGLSIGSDFAGGIIFYLDDTGCHGLVCAPSDQSHGFQWSRGKAIETSASGKGLGDGASNTKLIIASSQEGECAAKLCDDLVIDGYADWYLPSLDELNLIYKNLYLKEVGHLMWGYYWSSTEFSNFLAYYQCFYDGEIDNADKVNPLFVRAIRAF